VSFILKLLNSPYMALTLVPLIWGSNFVIGKQLTATFPPFTLTAGRFGVALLLLLPIFWYTRRKRKREKIAPKIWGILFFLGFTGTFAFGVMLYAGLRHTTPVNATLINAFNPTLTIMLSILFLGEKLRGKQLIGFILSFIGVIWIAVQGQPERLMSMTFNQGDLLILAAALVWAIYNIAVKKIAKDISPMDLTTYSMFFGVLLLLPSAYFELKVTPVTVPITWTMMAALIYLGVFCSVVAFFLWNRGIAQVGPSKAAMLYNLIPVSAAVLSYLILGEIPQGYHWLGGTLVLWGVIWGVKRDEQSMTANAALSDG